MGFLQQLFLDFPLKEEFLAEDFFVSNANYQAFRYIMQWPSWTDSVYSRILFLYADKGSGKTHLAHIWQNIAKAEFITLESYREACSDALIIENIEKISDEEGLFHLINFVIENKKYLLLTSQASPSKLRFKLPDLKSRINALTHVSIEAPDQELLKAVLLKNLSERQLKIHPATIDYVLSRIDRSFEELFNFICNIERYSKTNKRPVTIQTAKHILSLKE